MRESADTVTSTVSKNLNSKPDPTHHDANASGGILAGAKQQLDYITNGASITQIKNKITTMAGETASNIKENVFDGVVPAAGETLQGAQARVQSLADTVNGSHNDQANQESNSPHPEHEMIDQMDEEEICDFLRERHRSTAPPRPTIK
ncbi:hypothetical protein N7462_008507 [Penicillium macrosclerotiorum]|uniref:uncharacterized protein n=1 Tax=Penicillium macrosclerotiorum TaxID=303699 RepID=UPI002546A8B7|nr:uncharacterized protein N7462_008507 [Penicillium macrosclerotiorum]KAJ5675610.1 hypothetical protein N7462_008507 [Penicillium macrosclerotiorum]